MSIGALGAIFGTSFVVSLSGALSPGPLSTLAVREGARRGFWAGPALAAGHGIVELLLVIGLALGLNQLLDREEVTASVALVGGAFLLWLGLRALLTAPGQELEVEEKNGPPAPAPAEGRAGGAGPRMTAVSPAAAAALALAGVVVSVTNPFWVAWWATIGTAYVVEALDEGAAGIASFYGAHFLTDLGWLSLVAFMLASGRRIMSRWAYRVVLAACAIFLLALGGWFLASGLGYVV